MRTLNPLPLVALLLAGCPPADEDLERAADAGAGVLDGGAAGSDASTLAPPAEVAAHPCGGNRTDALWHDAPSTFFVGCGTTTEGRGLYRSQDGGASWAAVPAFDTWRVDDVRRAADGRLYVAGRDTAGGARVAWLDGDAATPVWSATSTASFDVYRFARAADGRAMGESLTGNDILFRADDAEDFTVTSDWPTDGASYQMLDLTLHAEQFYAVGSTIAQPPVVFVPGDAHGALQPVQIAPERTGELWGLALSDDVFVAVGIDQNENVGLLAVAGADPSDAAGWNVRMIDDLVDGRSWLRGACARGASVVAVGERQPLRNGGAIVLRSDDAGATWRVVELDDAPSALHRCAFTEAGVVVTGTVGFFGYLPR